MTNMTTYETQSEINNRETDAEYARTKCSDCGQWGASPTYGTCGNRVECKVRAERNERKGAV